MPLGMLGKYERLDILGHGASGIVYLAQDTLLRRRVALKEITAQGEDKRRVLEEARVLDRLRHPNIVAVHGVDTINGKVVIDMEYVSGSNLLEIMRQADGPMPISDSLDIAVQICDGLAYAHSMRTVHRDIKPANILVSTEHHVKLADFGLAQVLGTNSYAGGAGTFAYMAPEDFEEGDRSDQQSDLWAVGVILYEMLTGRRPFNVTNARDPFSWSRAISRDTIEPPSTLQPNVSHEIDQVCLKALQKGKADRYQHASDMASDLRRVTAPVTAGFRVHIPMQTVSIPTAPIDLAPDLMIGAVDIDTLLTNAPIRWEEICAQLVSGGLSSWLDRIHEPLLARVASELGQESGRSAEIRMRDFLYRAGIDLDRAARANARLGTEYISNEKYVDAILVLKSAVNLDPSQPTYFRMLAKAERSAGNIATARDVLNKGISLHPIDRGLKRDIAHIGGAKPQLSTSYVNFGQLRHGEVRTITIALRSIGPEPVKGRVASTPGWLKVTPLSFNGRARQILKLVAESGTLPKESNDYEESVIFETPAGSISLPVALNLLPKRPSFASVFYWYLPMMAFCLLPTLVGQFATVSSYRRGRGEPLSPAGLIASGTLFAAFLAINVIVDTRLRERIFAAAGIVLGPIGIVYLFSLSQTASQSMAIAWPVVVESSIAALSVPIVQVITLVRSREAFSQWPIWCGAIAVVSLIVSAILWHAGAGGVQ